MGVSRAIEVLADTQHKSVCDLELHTGLAYLGRSHFLPVWYLTGELEWRLRYGDAPALVAASAVDSFSYLVLNCKASHGCFRLDGNLQPTSRLEALFEVSKDLEKICATLREKPNARVLGKLDVMLDYCNYALMRCELEHRILNKLINPASIGEERKANYALLKGG